MFSLLSSNNNKENERRKSTSLLTHIAKNSDTVDGFDLDLLHSVKKQPASESALYAAMDTSIGAGALNSYLSQMVLMQYNDSQTRMTNSLTQRSALSDNISGGTSNVFTSALVPMIFNPTEEQTGSFGVMADQRDGESQRKSSFSNSFAGTSSKTSFSRKSSSASESSVTRGLDGKGGRKLSSFWQSLPGFGRSRSGLSSPVSTIQRSHLHPSDCSTRRRRSGVANVSVDSESLTTNSEDARMVQMKGKLLTGDEVKYSYVAMNTAVEGRDTVVLYTDHPKPKFRSDFSISEKTLVNSSTGLYRTLVGDLPRNLNVAAPTGIPSLDSRHDSIDSGTANDDSDSIFDSRGYVKIEKPDNTTKDNKLPIPVTKERTTGDWVRYSFSPSFEDRETNENRPDVNAHLPDVIENCPQFDAKKESGPPTYEEVAANLKFTGKDSNSVRVYQRRPSGVSQVVINRKLKKADSNEHIKSSSTLEVSTDSKTTKSKGRFANLIAKTLWRGHSNQSIRSASTDSGYKHSMSLDDSSVNPLSPKGAHYLPQPPIDESSAVLPHDSGKINTTVVTIENDRNQKLNSVNSSKRGSLKRNSMKKRGNLEVNEPDMFDQNKTIEQSPLPGRKVELPTFFDPDNPEGLIGNGRAKQNGRDSNPRRSRSSAAIMEEYVILDDEARVKRDRASDKRRVGLISFLFTFFSFRFYVFFSRKGTHFQTILDNTKNIILSSKASQRLNISSTILDYFRFYIQPHLTFILVAIYIVELRLKTYY